MWFKYERDTRSWMIGTDTCKTTLGRTLWIYFLCWCWEINFYPKRKR